MNWKEEMEKRNENSAKHDQLVEEYIRLTVEDRGYPAATGGLHALLSMLFNRLDVDAQEMEILLMDKDVERIRGRA